MLNFSETSADIVDTVSWMTCIWPSTWAVHLGYQLWTGPRGYVGPGWGTSGYGRCNCLAKNRSFPAVSAPILKSKYALFRNLLDQQDYLLSK